MLGMDMGYFEDNAERNRAELIITITDQGEGFDHKHLTECEAKAKSNPHANYNLFRTRPKKAMDMACLEQ